MNVTGLRIAVPATPQDAYWQLCQAIRTDEPIIMLEHELLYFNKGPLDVNLDSPPMHRAHIHRQGNDLTIVSYSRMLDLSLRAAEQLASKGIAAEVIDLRSLRPIDWSTCVASLEKIHRLLVVEEDSRFAGAGAEIAAGLTERCFYSLDAPPQRVAALELPTPFNATLEAASIPCVVDIVTAAEKLCAHRTQRSGKLCKKPLPCPPCRTLWKLVA